MTARDEKIPEGWREKKLDDLFDFSGGVSASRAQLSTNGYPYLHYGDIHNSSRTFIDVYNNGKVPCLDIPLSKVSNNALLKDGDVVFVDASEDDEGASRHVVVRNGVDKPFISGLHTIVAKSKTDELDNLFKEFCFSAETVKSQFKFYAVGTKVMGVNKVTIKKIGLQYPVSKFEQHAIAESLSDMDGYIASLETLIAKKKAVKQGAMQELLAGKRRLPGFTGEWEEKKINSLGIFISGSGFPIAFQGEHIGLPFYKVSDFNNVGNRTTMDKSNNYITRYVAGLLNCNIIPKHSIIFAKVGAAIFLERKRMVLHDCCIDNNMMAFLVDDNKNYAKYIYYLLKTIKFGDFITSTALPSLSSKVIGEIVRLFPPTKAEQSAIAAVLSDMDAEIEALTAKLNKAELIKQGMMQELLTGRIRLKNCTRKSADDIEGA